MLQVQDQGPLARTHAVIRALRAQIGGPFRKSVYLQYLGEPSKLFFGKSWAFGPISGTPPSPLPVSWAAKKRKKVQVCILGYSKYIIFS